MSRELRNPTVVYAGELHEIIEQHCNGAQVKTRCRLEFWMAPAHRNTGRQVPTCRTCFPGGA